MFPNIINILNISPQSQRSDADGETREESEGGADGHPHHSRNSRRIAEFVARVEANEVPKQAVALCVVVEVAESVGWCTHGRGSRARDVVVDVKSGGRCRGSRRGPGR